MTNIPSEVIVGFNIVEVAELDGDTYFFVLN